MSDDYEKARKLLMVRILEKRKVGLRSDIERLDDLEKELDDMAKGKIPYDNERIAIIEKALNEMEKDV